MISPLGDEIAVLKDDLAAIDIYALDGSRKRSITAKGWGNIWALEWAPDAKSLFVGTHVQPGPTLLQVFFDGRSKVLWQPGRGNDELWGIPSPDGNTLAIKVSGYESNAWVVDLP
jgi:hypothetical protein